MALGIGLHLRQVSLLMVASLRTPGLLVCKLLGILLFLYLH